MGVNNHFQSIIFAGVLMTDEAAESFEWVFSEFLILMGGKRPQTILTGLHSEHMIQLSKSMLLIIN